MNWHFDRSNFTVVSVVFVRAMWSTVSPVHMMMTLDKSVNATNFEVSSSVIILVLLAFLGFVIGFLVAFLWSWKTSSNRTDDPEPGSTNDANDDYFYY